MTIALLESYTTKPPYSTRTYTSKQCQKPNYDKKIAESNENYAIKQLKSTIKL